MSVPQTPSENPSLSNSMSTSWVTVPLEGGNTVIPQEKKREFPTPVEAIERGLNPTPEVSEMGESELGIPSVTDMLEKGATTKSHIPPKFDQGNNLSFAEVAATEPPPAPPSYSKRDGAAPPKQETRQGIRQETPPPMGSRAAFPSLTQANPVEPNGRENDLSEIPTVKEMLDAPSVGKFLFDYNAVDRAGAKSYVAATTTNLKEAPPAAVAKSVDKVPVYNETQFLQEEKSRFQNKVIHNDDHRENPDIVETPEVQQVIEEVIEKEVVEEEEVKVINVTEEHDIDRQTTMTDLQRHVNFFDRNQDGKVTMDETYISLRALGYSVFISIPATLILHLRFSPPTSPHPPPFRYRTLYDLFTLPIHTSRIHKALFYTPLLAHTRAPRARNFRSGAYDLATGEFRQDQFDNAMSKFSTTAKIARVGVRVVQDGKYKASVAKDVDELQKGELVDSIERSTIEGVGFWKGLRMVGGIQQEDRGRWWDVSGWLTNKFQWYLTYSLLRDRRTGLVTRERLRGTYDGSTFYQIEDERYQARQLINREKREKA